MGFCVARSDRVGNAKASIRGTSDRHSFPRFFVYMGEIITLIKHAEFGEAAGVQKIKI